MKFGPTLLAMGLTFWLGGWLTLIFTMTTKGPVPNLLLGIWAAGAMMFCVAGLIAIGIHAAAGARS
jgi:hypothetical protein